MKGIEDTANGQCESHLNIQGEDFRCQYGTDHDGWAHGSKVAQAIWK